MRAEAGVLIFICLVFLVGTVGAAVGNPDTVIVTTDKSYLTANGVDQSTVTVSVSNTTPPYSGVIVGASVNFSVNDPTLGTLNPIQAPTLTNGKATSIFKVNTKSGNATIRADVSYPGATGLSNFTIQKIDHDKAHFATFSHPIEGAVGTKVSFNISFTDLYGNPIDQIINSGQQHTINLHVHGPTPDDCVFVGYGHDIPSQALDKNGNVNVTVQLSSGAGPNSVTMDTFEEIVTPVPRIITGLSNEVFSMEQLFIPDSPAEVPADGVNKFSIQYTLFDKFLNPVSQQGVWVNTSIAGEEALFKSDNLGHISITYGPRVTVGVITINATSVGNASVTRSHSVEFTSTAATNMVLTANPEYMPSRDIPPYSSSSDITATVTDVSGNPVENETVTFSLVLPEQYPGGPYNVTSPPTLPPPLIVKTDANGHAMVQFIPGSFSTNKTNLYFDATATGTCIINALWNTTSKNILVTWKNYPYLSVKTSVDPPTVEVNKTVDVNIKLTADGWAMQPDPIDVILVMDRSGSMDDSMSGHTKLYYAKIAAKTFVAQMNQTRDQIGVVSYAGYTSGTGTHTDISLSHSTSGVNNAIDALNANGATETREALYQSIALMKANPNSNPNAKQAIILMTDGNFNWKGDPIAIGRAQDSSYNSYSTNAIETSNFLWYSGLGCSVGSSSCTLTNQNMSRYANTSNIRIYTIGFSANANDFDPQAISAMQIMANATGGFYQYAPDATTLNQIYTKIAGELNDKAGVNTTMATDFQNVNVNNVSISGAQVYDYVYNATASTKIKWQNGVTNVTNQSADWAADSKLDFTIGTMKVGQTWEATFRLKVKKSGIIDVFGTNSVLLFNGTEPLTLPHTFITVVPSLNATGLNLQTIDVSSSCPAQASQAVILPITWITNYTGPANTITEDALYISESGAHVPFYHGSFPVTGDTLISRSAQFDMRTVPPGNYAIQIVTQAGTAIATSQSCGNYTYSTKGVTFIKLK